MGIRPSSSLARDPSDPARRREATVPKGDDARGEGVTERRVGVRKAAGDARGKARTATDAGETAAESARRNTGNIVIGSVSREVGTC
mmetsp:Transcript_10695/g.16136  ORF Transcript_10695/g.16136 Transcript_10695/m.16136 type:complete len:87 (+) Transcript_10695:487-747(+)